MLKLLVKIVYARLPARARVRDGHAATPTRPPARLSSTRAVLTEELIEKVHGNAHDVQHDAKERYKKHFRPLRIGKVARDARVDLEVVAPVHAARVGDHVLANPPGICGAGEGKGA